MLIISINWISSTEEMKTIMRKSMSKLVMQPGFRAVGQTRRMVDIWKPENKRQMYGSKAWGFSSFSNVYHFTCLWPTPLKHGCVTNLDMLFLVMGFISLVDGIQFILISSRHICISLFISISMVPVRRLLFWFEQFILHFSVLLPCAYSWCFSDKVLFSVYRNHLLWAHGFNSPYGSDVFVLETLK